MAYILATGKESPTRITLDSAQVAQFLTRMAGVFTAVEMQSTKVLTKPAGQEPSLEDLGRVISLEQLIAGHQALWLEDLITNNRYHSLFQPIFDSRTNEVFAHEALFRGRDEKGEQVSPGYLFGLAARAKMLFQADTAARRSAVESAAKGGLTSTNLFINFNPSSVYDPGYCLRTTVSAIEALGLKPHQVVFEVTESEHVPDVQHLKGILAFYRAAGFKTALDDVGAGYSGLNLLQDLHPDFLKIDMHLIRDIDIDTFRQSIVRHIIGLAHENNIKVVAEGIETDAEWAWVKNAGADYLQGFRLARPRTAQDAQAALTMLAA